MTQEQALRVYGKHAGQCSFCMEWGLEDGHFDGTYFTCDPNADCNKPGYDRQEDGNRM